MRHLSVLEQQGTILTWHDRQITPGTDWEGQIDQYLESAQVILLLISSDFMASKYCFDVEMKRALDRHDSGEAQAIPILLRPVAWKNSPLSRLQALPANGTPVTSWKNQDEAFLKIVTGISETIGKHKSKASEKVNEHPNGNIKHTVIGTGIKKQIVSLSVAILAFAAVGSAFWLQTRPTIIRVKAEPQGPHPISDYYYELLKRVLEETESEGKFKLERVKINTPEFERLIYLDRKEVDIIWTMTTVEREFKAKPIRIPLTRGLLAHRICLIRKDEKNKFSDIQNLKDFLDKKFSIGQRFFWPDTRILKDAKIPVRESKEYSQLFFALERGDFDCFARGASEILQELSSNKNLMITLEENLVFIYRSPIYFFVKNNNDKLAARLETGLDRILKNGKFCDLFLEHFKDDIEKLKIHERTPIRILNAPPPKTPSGFFFDFESPQMPCAEEKQVFESKK